MSAFPLSPSVLEPSHLADLHNVVSWTSAINILNSNHLMATVSTHDTFDAHAVLRFETHQAILLLIHRAQSLVVHNSQLGRRLASIDDN